MSTRMTINGVSTCTEAGTEKYEKFQTADASGHLCSTTTATRTGNCFLASNPH